MSECDRIIASLSDAELLIWHGLHGFARLDRRQVARVYALLDEAKREAGPAPRDLSPGEWAALVAEACDLPPGKRAERAAWRASARRERARRRAAENVAAFAAELAAVA